MANEGILGLQEQKWSGSFGEVDHLGKPVERSKFTHPYSYSPHIIMGEPGSDHDQTDYSDRLMQWDWDKFNGLSMKHFGNEGQVFYDRPMDKIEAFLQDYHNDPKLKLVMVSQGANMGNGFPYWIFFSQRGK